ncbi:MAG: bifunctional riboflavin kinase/FAD synthetase, partial [Lachnospiraceae bacterium]|nr:bifunctional riboflavin kinase/FAD synthetase [Lachnospiraceae bacterium]
MRILHNFGESKLNKNAALTVGKFDGLHLGHDYLIDQIVQ